MKVKPEQLLSQVLHLLDNVESADGDPEVEKEIEGMKGRVKGLIHLVLIGKHPSAVDLGIDLLEPDLNELAQRVRVKD